MTLSRPVVALSLATLLLATAAAEARRTTVVHRGPRRTTVVVHRSFPLHRRWPAVVVHPVRARVALVAPIRFLPIVAWRAPVVVLPPRERIVWEDSEVFTKEEEWTEISLGVHDHGSALLLEVEGRARLDFAEVVFANGDTQVVDFDRKNLERGHFTLLDFRDGRQVSHVRLLAKAESETARIVLRMET